LGVSEKLSKSCKGNFAGAEGGSLGMRLGEVADSPFTGRGNERKFGKGKRKKERGEGQMKFQESYKRRNRTSVPKGARHPFGKA